MQNIKQQIALASVISKSIALLVFFFITNDKYLRIFQLFINNHLKNTSELAIFVFPLIMLKLFPLRHGIWKAYYTLFRSCLIFAQHEYQNESCLDRWGFYVASTSHTQQ